MDSRTWPGGMGRHVDAQNHYTSVQHRHPYLLPGLPLFLRLHTTALPCLPPPPYPSPTTMPPLPTTPHHHTPYTHLHTLTTGRLHRCGCPHTHHLHTPLFSGAGSHMFWMQWSPTHTPDQWVPTHTPPSGETLVTVYSTHHHFSALDGLHYYQFCHTPLSWLSPPPY